MSTITREQLERVDALLNRTARALGAFVMNHRNPSADDTVKELLGLHDTAQAVADRNAIRAALSAPPAPAEPARRYCRHLRLNGDGKKCLDCGVWVVVGTTPLPARAAPSHAAQEAPEGLTEVARRVVAEAAKWKHLEVSGLSPALDDLADALRAIESATLSKVKPS